ncbi:MAG: hypothetical protein MZV64_38185 [Ignavibacteriales bacterium]|nr:hypothetical protein [Ignavibacteriales bacterium]
MEVLADQLYSPEYNFFISGEVDNYGSYLPFGYNKASSFFSKLTTTVIPYIQNFTYKQRQLWETDRITVILINIFLNNILRVRTDSWQSSLNLTHTVQNNFFYDVKASYFNQGYYSGINKDTSEYLASTEYGIF